MRRHIHEELSCSPGPRNVAARLLGRQSSSRSPQAFRRAMVEEFANFSLKRTYDLHIERPDDEKFIAAVLRRRSKVTEILPTDHFLFALTFSGVCIAFSRNTNKRICIVNTSAEEVIRSIFWNKENNSLLTISVSRSDSRSLRCRSTFLTDIAADRPGVTQSLFSGESLEWPGFIELDEINRKIITHSTTDRTYKIWDMRTYALLYELNEPTIHEVKVSPGVLLVIYQRPATISFLPLTIYDIETGKPVHTFQCQLHRTKKIEYIELFHDKLLIKQANELFRIVDVQNRAEQVLSYSELALPRSLIYLNQLQRFLTYDEKSIQTWNFQGEKVASFDEHTFLHAESQPPVHTSGHQDYVFSVCKSPAEGLPCIAVSDLRSGRFIGRFYMPADCERDLISSISVLNYDEANHELLCGTADGRVQVWSAG